MVPDFCRTLLVIETNLRPWGWDAERPRGKKRNQLKSLLFIVNMRHIINMSNSTFNEVSKSRIFPF